METSKQKIILNKLLLKVNHIVFWFYYKRVPIFFHKWTILKSISLLKQNYEHAEFRIDGLNEVINNAIKREREMQLTISNLQLKLRGVPQDKIDIANKMFGTNLQGKSNLEQNN